MSKAREIALRIGAVLVPVALLLTWEVAVRRGWLPSSQAATPSDIAARLWALLIKDRSGDSPPLYRHALYSLARLAAEVLIGTCSGILTAAWAASIRTA